MSTIKELEKLNDKLHQQSSSREKYYTLIIGCVISFALGYIVGLF